MKILKLHGYPRDIEAGDLIEIFLISAISSILVIRTFLFLTEYPQFGGVGFHIAHMLWGGFLMMVALFLSFIFLNKESKYIASFIGGVGFGTFIDELGKFVTHDNNYFYQPTIAMIYVIFVILFLGLRVFEKRVKYSKEEYGVNALETTKQVLMHDLDEDEKKKAFAYLKKSDKNNPIISMLKRGLQETHALPVGEPNIFHQIQKFAKDSYIRIIHSPRFTNIAVLFFVIASFINFLQAFFNFSKASTFSEWGQLVFSTISGFLVLIGVYCLILLRSRKEAYLMFKYAVLVSIFLTQFFRFLEEQLSAITGLFISLLILSALQYLIYEENLLEKES